MSSTNRLILVLLPLVAAAIAFWLLLLAPKRQEASDLERDAAGLRSQVEQQEQLAASAETARKDFPRAYRRLVVLGKAAPEDDDTSSLLVQLDAISRKAGVNFISLTNEGEAPGAETAPATEPQTPAATAEQDEQTAANVEEGQPATPPPATEAQAALLPIGATIGPAGLPVMRYTLTFEGDFFKLADFIAGIDEMVRTSSDGDVRVRGRLVTVDSFDLSPNSSVAASSNPSLAANFQITTYLTPAEQGVTGGASPTGPAPATAPQPASASSTPPATETAATTAP